MNVAKYQQFCLVNLTIVVIITHIPRQFKLNFRWNNSCSLTKRDIYLFHRDIVESVGLVEYLTGFFSGRKILPEQPVE